MSFKEKIISILFSSTLSRNTKFKNKHKDETCYIIGNGGSLKYMDLSLFSDNITIGINHLCLHKDFKKLDVRYYAVVESFFLYPYCKNPYTKKYQVNILGDLFRRSFPQDKEINLFVSLTNILGHRLKNINYLYHFGRRIPDVKNKNISGAFSFMSGGLHAGIGLAINMGFKKAILVGCDYTFTPIANGHFYSKGHPRRSNKGNNNYQDLFNESKELIELSVITDQGSSNILPYQTYEEFTGKRLKYHENTEIVNAEYLGMLRKAVELKQYGSPV